MKYNEDTINRQLRFMAACDLEEKLLVVDEYGYGVFEVNKDTGKSELLLKLSQVNRRLLYQAVEKYGNKIYFFPYNMEQFPIMIYELKNKKISYLDLYTLDKNVFGNYIPISRVGNVMWLFPVDIHNDLISFDLSNEKVKVIDTWKAAMKAVRLNYTNNFRKVDGRLIVGESVYLTIKQTNIIVEINCSTHEIRVHRLDEGVSLYGDCDYDGKNIWIIDSNGGVIEWNPNEGIISHTQCVETRNHQGIICGKEHIWLIPYLSDNRIVKMNYKSKELEMIELFPGKFEYESENTEDPMFGMIYRKESCVDLYSLNGNMVVHIDLGRDIILEKYEMITLPDDWSNEDIMEYEIKSSRESKRMNTSSFFDVLFAVDAMERKYQDKHSYGENIWKQIR